jgi:hypothetical protein
MMIKFEDEDQKFRDIIDNIDEARFASLLLAGSVNSPAEIMKTALSDSAWKSTKEEVLKGNFEQCDICHKYSTDWDKDFTPIEISGQTLLLCPECKEKKSEDIPGGNYT